MKFVYHDGGRSQFFKGTAGDCVARSIAIVSGMPYDEIYQRLASGQEGMRRTKRKPKAGKRSARNGIYTKTKWFKDFMEAIGFEWTPTMQIGQGCKVHLADGELPNGKLIVSVSRHYTAVIDQVIYDTYDPQRRTAWYDNGDGIATRFTERCVYGYWRLVN